MDSYLGFFFACPVNRENFIIWYFEDKEICLPFAAIYLAMAIRSLAVFCGSKHGMNPVFTHHAEQLGKLMAEYDVKLIYGGGSAGIMGTIADSVMNHGGKVTGIIPKI